MPTTAKKFATALLTGAVMVSGAWAGASLVPVDDARRHRRRDRRRQVRTRAPGRTRAHAGDCAAEGGRGPPRASARSLASLADGQVLAGAAKTSILPRPEDYDGTWERSEEKCATLSESAFTAIMDDPVEVGDHLAATGSPWPENPNCIYMGGFGIGPMNPVTSWNEELRPLGAGRRSARSPGRRPRPRRARRRGLLLGLRQEVRRLRHQAAHRPARGRRHARSEGRGHRGRGDARALLAGLHRRLGLRSRLVHGAGLRHDQVDDPQGAREDAPGGARVRRTRGAPVQLRAPRHVPLGRGAAARVAARVRARQQEDSQHDDRHHRRLRRPSHHVRHQRREGPSRLARAVRGEPREAVRRPGDALHDRTRERLGLRARARGRPEARDRCGRSGGAGRRRRGVATGSSSPTSRRRRPRGSSP